MVELSSALQVKKIESAAIIPTRGSALSAGYDLYALGGYKLDPGERKLIHTGISIAVPSGFYGRVAPRSGLALKHGIDTMAGVIDEDYRGEVGVILVNLATTRFLISPGDRVAQLIIEAIFNPEVVEVAELTSTVRGDGGFGSTGIGADGLPL